MYHKLCLTLFFLPQLLFAQQSECVFIDWSKHFGGSKSEAANDFQRTTDGGLIVAGYSRSADGQLTDNKGGADYWLIKLDTFGQLEWQRNYGGAENDFATAVLQTDDGGYIVAGGVVSFDGHVTGNHGEEDAWIVRLDGQGNIIWKRAYGGSQNDRAESIQPTSDGGYVVSGYSQSSDGDLSGNSGEFDYWVFKINANGNLIWQKSLGGSLAEFAFDAVETMDGGYLVAGSSISGDGDLTANFGVYDYWVAKLDAGGNLVWQKNYGGNGEERAYGIAVTPSGAVVVGTTNSISNDVPSNYGVYDCWAIKIADDGGLVWSRNYGGSFEDRALGVAAIANGGVLVTGFSASPNQDLNDNNGSKDGWLINLSPDGDIVWQKNLGGSFDDRLFYAQQLPDGSFACAGMSTSADQDLPGNFGEQDVWVIKLSPDSIRVDLGNDTILCAGQGIILDPDFTDVDFLWSDGSTAPVLLASSPAEYWVEIDKEGCKSRDTILVAFVSETPVDIGNDTILCVGDSLVLDPGIAGATVFWRNGSTAPTLTVEQPGAYWVEVSKDGCEYRDSIEIGFTEVPFALEDELKFCQGETKTLDLTLPNASYLWQDGSTEPTFTVTLPGLIWAKVTQGGCSRTDSVFAEIQDGPADPLPDLAYICEGQGVWFNADFEEATYKWQDGSTLHNFKAIAPGEIKVVVTVGDCVFEDRTELRSCERCLYVPNVFSPNGDGINDEFRGFLGDCEISNFRLAVFDRWGNLVFSTDQPELGWDGDFKGEKTQQASFVYNIEFDYINNGINEHQTRTGTIELMR
ncbi:MAG: gliding motility-associated C-terminal domain-containing protein [Saprospiraceae bacterium]|jgi:gliding motility-associated-like protein|nr:gliding motility-associated C-terminal domain-containing protein [Saprospiraceae bacterium]